MPAAARAAGAAALALAAALAAGAAAPAAAQALADSPGTLYEASGLAGSQTFAGDMAGLFVVAEFSHGGFDLGSWSDLGGGVWGVQGASFALTFAGETFTDAWTLQNLLAPGGLSIVGLTLRGAPGRTVFDRTFGGADGTPGSDLGRDLEFVGAGLPGSSAHYTNLVRIGGAPPVGDVFERVELVLGVGGLGGGDALEFRLDTDRIEARGAFDTAVPEPESWALVAGGLGAVALAGRRRPRRA